MSTTTMTSIDIPQECGVGQNNYDLLTTTRYDTYWSWNDDEGPSSFFMLPSHFTRLIEAAEMHGWSRARSILLDSGYKNFKSRCLAAVASKSKNSSGTAADDDEVFLKVRITLSQEGELKISATPLPSDFHFDPVSGFKPPDKNITRLAPAPFDCLYFDKDPTTPVPSMGIVADPHVSIYIDKEAITPSIFTRTKTTFRDIYNISKQRNEDQHLLNSKKARVNCSNDPRDDINNPWDVLLYNQDGQITETTIFNIAFYISSVWVTPSTRSGCLAGVMRKRLLDKGRIIEDQEGMLTKDILQNGDWVLLFNGMQGSRLGRICM